VLGVPTADLTLPYGADLTLPYGKVLRHYLA
jgi:hypothetical protein